MEAASVRAGAKTERRRSKGIPERRLAVLMVAPSMVLIAIVAVWPILYAIWLSLHEYSVRVAGLSRLAGPYGLKNYSTALQSSDWAFLVHRDLASAYGHARAQAHRESLDSELASLGSAPPELRNLAPFASVAPLLI